MRQFDVFAIQSALQKRGRIASIALKSVTDPHGPQYQQNAGSQSFEAEPWPPYPRTNWRGVDTSSKVLHPADYKPTTDQQMAWWNDRYREDAVVFDTRYRADVYGRRDPAFNWTGDERHGGRAS